jgi:hypothetical protein
MMGKLQRMVNTFQIKYYFSINHYLRVKEYFKIKNNMRS